VADSRQTRSTLRDFLSTRGSSASGITLTPALGDTSPTDVVNEGDDLGIDPNTGEPVVGLDGLAAAYIAYLTQQAGNLYTIEPSGETAAPADRGDPITPPDQQGATRVFARPGTTLGQAMQLSNSGRQDSTDYPLTTYLDKTGGDPQKSGDSLLSGVVGRELDTTGNPQIDTYVNTETQSGRMQTGILQSVDQDNRVSSQRATVPFGTTTSQLDEVKFQSTQRAFGEYQVSDSPTAEAYTYDQIRGVGAWLLTSAAGYTIPGSQNSDQFFRGLADAQDLSIPGAAVRMSTKLGGDTLTFDSVAPRYTRPTPSTYTSDTPFSDTTKPGNVKLSQARAYIAINKLATLLKIDGLVPVPADEADKLKSLGPYYMGGSIYSRINAYDRMITDVVLVPTKHPYADAVQAGMGVMLGKVAGGTGSPAQSPEYFGTLINSPGFWEAVASSAVDIIKAQVKPADNISAQYYIDLSRSKAVRVMNTFATVGDIVLQVTGKTYRPDSISSDIKIAAGVEQVDDLPVTAGTRISKSREGSGRSPLALSWRGNSVPGLYLLSDDVVRASLQMGNLLTGENPARGMLASTLVEKTYTDPNMKGSNARIPGDIVKIMEDKLDAEYVPFYFHDLRTNEIISFHAFLETLSDSFGASFTSFKAFGRADPVQMYSSTSRSVSLSFIVAATSRDDFDEMWYKLNRLIACVYPKYAPGQQVINKEQDITFEQPFSQVVGATPLMRLRVGDVVKSNYSRFNLARFFGIGSERTNVNKFDSSPNNFLSNISKSVNKINNALLEFYSIFGSPVKTIAAASNLGATNTNNAYNTTATNVVSNFLVNGFVNPIGYGLMTAWSQNPDNPDTTDLESIIGLSDIGATQNRGYPSKASIAYLKPRERPYDVVDAAGNVTGKFVARRSLRVFITSRKNQSRTDSTLSLTPEQDGILNPIGDSDALTRETRYIVTIIDPGTWLPKKRDGASTNATFESLQVTHDDLLPDFGSVFALAGTIINPIQAITDLVTAGVDSAAAAVNINPSSIYSNAQTEGVAGFMSPQNNAIVRAFENNKGRGLAGVIKQLSFNWMDFSWETDWGARAPMGTKVTISFECIHDLPPGLDASGYMRAPTHNVGSVMNTISGDPHDDGGVISKQNFIREGASTVTKR
jgi:hypothetical protein